ncbi:MAG: hypothetical protein A2X01_00250 [Bacteroidetes bacterium GWF2_35_48]|nr:MAG: hypothetical protein A2X01_00250 [Bacteroidetes bacterium GWF2_35_48]OFZ01411.1 MAG: hypothetical protein A2491_19670 [Bacteroidetes bacterium RIFOXYC12_FULL_35_7]
MSLKKEYTLKNIRKSFRMVNNLKIITGKKIKAFTMMELLVTIVISSLVIGFALGVYFHLNNYYLKGHSKFTEVNEVISLYSLMNTDMENAREMYVLSDRINFAGINTSICYKFYNEYIVREQQFSTDTFFIIVTNLQDEKIDPYSDLSGQVTFIAEKEKEQYPFTLKKKYASEVYFNLSLKKK